jgi:hypothetical protein
MAEHRHHLGTHFKQLLHFLLRWAATRWKWQRFLSKEETRLELEECRHRAIQAFVTQSITAEVPHWEEIVVQTQSRQARPPEYVKRRRGSKKIRSQQDPGLDLSLIQAAYSWQPALDQAVSESERTEWIGFWNEALDCLLRRLGAETEDEEEIPGTPNEVDHWVLCRIAGLITQLRHAERPADFWEPILSLGTPGHSWLQTFLKEWFVCGLRSEPASDAFVREWRAMLEYAFSSPKWSFDSAKRWLKLEEMWCVLIGFDRASHPLWMVSQKPVVKRMYEFYERWADRHLHTDRDVHEHSSHFSPSLLRKSYVWMALSGSKKQRVNLEKGFGTNTICQRHSSCSSMCVGVPIKRDSVNKQPLSTRSKRFSKHWPISKTPWRWKSNKE